jgi:hypothetical protein
MFRTKIEAMMEKAETRKMRIIPRERRDLVINLMSTNCLFQVMLFNCSKELS